MLIFKGLRIWSEENWLSYLEGVMFINLFIVGSFAFSRNENTMLASHYPVILI